MIPSDASWDNCMKTRYYGDLCKIGCFSQEFKLMFNLNNLVDFKRSFCASR